MSRRTERIAALRVVDHDRASAGMRYVYPVVSRRARGVSIGVNLNPNDACNWRCVYCQVPGLTRGAGPRIDCALLTSELEELLEDVLHGDFMARAVPEAARRLSDVAFSGNGEPTSSPDFAAAVAAVGAVLARFELVGKLKLVLITNGSLMGQRAVQTGVRRLAALGGEVWFKLDSATRAGSAEINGQPVNAARHLDKLRIAARLCPTWVQTCWFRRRDAAPSDVEQAAYCEALAALLADGVALRGVHLYTLARPSHQPEAPELAPLEAAWLRAAAERIGALGLPVEVSA